MKRTIGSITYYRKCFRPGTGYISRALIARPGIVNVENARRYITRNVIYAKIFYKFWFINRLMYRVARTRVAHFIYTPGCITNVLCIPSLPPRALWSTGESGADGKKCGVHNSIIDCTCTLPCIWASFLRIPNDGDDAVCVFAARADGGRNIIPISDVIHGRGRGEVKMPTFYLLSVNTAGLTN